MADDIRVVEKLPDADISYLQSAVRQMDSEVSQLSYTVNDVNSQVNSVKRKFEQFVEEFRKYVVQDRMDRRYQEALNDRNNTQQLLDVQFSEHVRVRRYVTGILQAADVQLVRKETMEIVTSKLMISVPRYWLVPALVALAAWINDNRELAERALNEAIKRDDEKTCLLFALICRRAARNEAAMTWLQRYFAMQDPMNIERKMIVVLDAYANGLFGGDSKNLCAEQISGWISEMEDITGFRQSQVDRWEIAVNGKVPSFTTAKYPYIEKYSNSMPVIRQLLLNGGLHAALLDYVKGVLETPNEGYTQLTKQLDELLDSLVSNFDDEELPLRRQLRMAQLVIELKGDEEEATRRMEIEKSAFDEKTDLMQLLANAAMSGNEVHASAATRKLSLAASKNWLIEAYDNVVAKNRQVRLPEVSFKIDTYAGTSADGADAKLHVQRINEHYARLRDGDISAVKQSNIGIVLIILSSLMIAISTIVTATSGANMTVGIIIGVIALGLSIWKYFSDKKKVVQTKEDLVVIYDKRAKDNAANVMALCAEIVDMRRDIAALEANQEATRAYIEQITPNQFISSGGERRINIA